MTKIKILRFLRSWKLFFWFTVGLLLFFAVTPRGYAQTFDTGTSTEDAGTTNFVVDSESQIFPYKKNFIISSYYTPLREQKIFVTGSYENDVYLNGEGIHTADGTLVYPGIGAAPKRFPFGTKMEIPGFGIIAIHDRGGAIKGDRLDIWVGEGEIGLRRALAWGVKKLEVTVYGIDPMIEESVNFEALPLAKNIEFLARKKNFRFKFSENDEEAMLRVKKIFTKPLALHERGKEVQLLQEELKRLSFLGLEPTGNFGKTTEHAIFKFQQAFGIIGEKENYGAGVVGPRTLGKLNELATDRIRQERQIVYKAEKKRLLAQKVEREKNLVKEFVSNIIFSADIVYGARGAEVENLQKILKRLGFFPGRLTTEYFGDITKHSLLAFQRTHGLSESGNVDEKTKKMLNKIVGGV